VVELDDGRRFDFDSRPPTATTW